MTHFATRSSLVQHYTRKGRDLLHRINGPVSTIALHEMRGLYMELGLKIGELERMGHWENQTSGSACRNANTNVSPRITTQRGAAPTTTSARNAAEKNTV